MATSLKKAVLFLNLVFSVTCPPIFGLDDPLEGKQETTQVQLSKKEIEANIYSLVQGNNLFAFDLYALVREMPGNLCFSPYNITSALALPFAGAKSATQSEMRSVLHYLPKVDLVLGVYALLDKLYMTPWYLGSNESRMFSANSLWLQRSIKILPTFFDTVPKSYQNTIKMVDFTRNPEGARLNINQWIREKTEGRIPSEVQRDDIDNKTQMLIASALFIKGVWDMPFDPVISRRNSFFIDKLVTSSAPMMSISGKFRIYRGTDFTLLELPYRPSFQGLPKLSFMIALPTANFGLTSLEQKLAYDKWLGWIANLREEVAIVSVPKFSILQSFDLTEFLKKMGMPVPFSDQADFGGIFESKNVSIGKVVHDAYLSIDEKGSDAVSVTSVANPLMDPFSQEQQPLIVNANHPFLFFIVDTINNTILYIGRFVKP
jgi:serpin B